MQKVFSAVARDHGQRPVASALRRPRLLPALVRGGDVGEAVCRQEMVLQWAQARTWNAGGQLVASVRQRAGPCRGLDHFAHPRPYRGARVPRADGRHAIARAILHLQIDMEGATIVNSVRCVRSPEFHETGKAGLLRTERGAVREPIEGQAALSPQSVTGPPTDEACLPTDWDYARLADAYVRRPGYAPAAIDAFLDLAAPCARRMVIDLGAGTGHLTAPLAERAANIVALEPNLAMRCHGVAKTSAYANVGWVIGRMEDTRLPAGHFSLATCGSSFGVADHGKTLREVARILEPGGWFACLWNYRDLDDPLQFAIEAHIKASIPGFQYGARRQDQTPIIGASGLFEGVHVLQSEILHRLPKTEWIEAWRSHATLHRQAGVQFESVVDGIAAIVNEVHGETVEIPYVTRVWMARLRPAGERGGAA